MRALHPPDCVTKRATWYIDTTAIRRDIKCTLVNYENSPNPKTEKVVYLFNTQNEATHNLSKSTVYNCGFQNVSSSNCKSFNQSCLPKIKINTYQLTLEKTLHAIPIEHMLIQNPQSSCHEKNVENKFQPTTSYESQFHIDSTHNLL